MSSNNSSRYSNHSIHSYDDYNSNNALAATTITTPLPTSSSSSTALYHRFDDLPSTPSHLDSDGNRARIATSSDVSSRYISAPPSVSVSVSSASSSHRGGGGGGYGSGSPSGARMFGRSLSSGNAHIPSNAHPHSQHYHHNDNDNDDYDNTNTVNNGIVTVTSNNATATGQHQVRVTGLGTGTGGGGVGAVIPSKRHQYDTRTLPGVGVLHAATPASAHVPTTHTSNGRRGQSKTVLARSTTTPAQHTGLGIKPLVIPTPPSIAGATAATASSTTGGGGVITAGNRGRSRAASHAGNQPTMGDSFADYREETIVACMHTPSYNKYMSFSLILI
jgi:hypothetical protein